MVVLPAPAAGAATTTTLFVPVRSVTFPPAESTVPEVGVRNTVFEPRSVTSRLPLALAVAVVAWSVASRLPPPAVSVAVAPFTSGMAPFWDPLIAPVAKSVTTSPSATMLPAVRPIFLPVPVVVIDTFFPEPIACTLATVTLLLLVTVTPPLAATRLASVTALPVWAMAISPEVLAAVSELTEVLATMPVVAERARASALSEPVPVVMPPVFTESVMSSVAGLPTTMPAAPMLKLLSFRIVMLPAAVDAVSEPAEVSTSRSPFARSLMATALPEITPPLESRLPAVSVIDAVPEALMPSAPASRPLASTMVVLPPEETAESVVTSVLRSMLLVAFTVASGAMSEPVPASTAPATLSVADVAAVIPATFTSPLCEISIVPPDVAASWPADVLAVMSPTALSVTRPPAVIVPPPAMAPSAASAAGAFTSPPVATLPARAGIATVDERIAALIWLAVALG